MFMYMNQPEPHQNGLTVRQAAQLVGATEYDVRDAIAAGQLPHTTCILLDPTDVTDWAKDADA